MLKQLERLSLTAEGRYATTQELKFLRDYFLTVELRLSAYEKIRDAEDEIISQLEMKMREIEPEIFHMNSKDLSSMYQRDTKIIIRGAIAAMLIDDLDRLREHLLLWHRTIIKAFKVKHITELAHKTMPEIMGQFLTPEEFALVQPILQLNHAILSY